MVLNMGQNVIELSQYRDHFPELRTLGLLKQFGGGWGALSLGS